MFLMHYEHWETEAICLNALRSRDVGDAIPYKIDVFHKDAIFNVSYAIRILAKGGNVFERRRPA